jgi:uncharacterized Zn-finger protein
MDLSLLIQAAEVASASGVVTTTASDQNPKYNLALIHGNSHDSSRLHSPEVQTNHSSSLNSPPLLATSSDIQDSASVRNQQLLHPTYIGERRPSTVSSESDSLSLPSRPRSTVSDSNLHIPFESADKPFICRYTGCNKSFPRKADLNRHEKIHENYRPFTCPTCNKSFTQKSALKTHIRIHTGEKPFVCPYPGCDKAFSDSSSLARHKKLHVPDGLTYPCYEPGCSMKFSKKVLLLRHRKAAHSGSHEAKPSGVILDNSNNQQNSLYNNTPEPQPRPGLPGMKSLIISNAIP